MREIEWAYETGMEEWAEEVGDGRWRLKPGAENMVAFETVVIGPEDFRKSA